MRTNPKKETRLLLKRARLGSTLSRLKYQLYSRPLAQNPSAGGDQRATDSNKLKLTKEVLPAKNDEKHVGVTRTPEKLEELNNLHLAYCSPYFIRLTKLDSELPQDELVISEYVFGKVEDVDDIEPLFVSCGDKEGNGVSMATLKPGEEVEMNVIDIWSSILNERERKRDLATPSRLFMSCDQNYFFSKEMLKVNSFKKRYEDFKLSKVLNLYLQGVQHLKNDILKRLKAVCLKMPQRSSANVIDCGIFCMRHMESYLREGEKWQSGLNPNDVSITA
ncbi:hypothetical protein Cgig2_024289 [Carnegiea gigantea]|uniref:Ubiquitin-like protease family profile domain-containing protein n=1 Tax=Carnegiea gigantea TaxID=171969 RepID=A0A9Q1GUT7_9CARY|nr:hypothetical protein Cgig2_024289 [Carnegiea gigantea]